MAAYEQRHHALLKGDLAQLARQKDALEQRQAELLAQLEQQRAPAAAADAAQRLQAANAALAQRDELVLQLRGEVKDAATELEQLRVGGG